MAEGDWAEAGVNELIRTAMKTMRTIMSMIGELGGKVVVVEGEGVAGLMNMMWKRTLVGMEAEDAELRRVPQWLLGQVVQRNTCLRCEK